ncbi:hypothetical protein LEP1GSC029_3173 [Leptospira interrogans str. 2002000626]|uniref:Uncharacterized protein n=2 Tax=Leptospira interrogans TaxID=173 RepID=A0A829DBL6_LEPIR|nr:hypothetical protein LEP1GSC029_3173 [Leptospira interrogans str. 2002000626]EMY25677.1 hypothetical protein LEP1GSC115_1459 [Leptospira interrogans serovar Australis str. 200703203]
MPRFTSLSVSGFISTANPLAEVGTDGAGGTFPVFSSPFYVRPFSWPSSFLLA